MGLNSMTGFGRFRLERNGRTIGVDVQSVNSKQLDLNMRMPFVYKPIENDLRQLVASVVERGKVDVMIHVESDLAATNPGLNVPIALHYIRELKKLEAEAGEFNTDYLSIISRLPDVFKTKNAEPDQQEIDDLTFAVQQALIKFSEFRATEGKKLELELMPRVGSIQNLILEVEALEESRISRIRERLEKNFFEFFSIEITDKNRFEQEMIYYLEKLDITEEKVRLRSHCEYFFDVIKEPSPGRKLNFISQEMGREINTLGSKSNHAGIQKLVVLMKDELEKIKEQLLNVL
jgi:uncharacterized protein (TIGR00255 family)